MRAVPFEGERKMTVIIPPIELQELLQSTVSYSISAENVHRHRSSWAEMTGKEVASPSITMLDDPFDAKGMLSCGYDDEGVRTSRKVLIDRGVLKTFLYDSYNAQKAGVKPTGNAIRRSSIDSQNLYRNGIDIDPVNLVVKPGAKSLEQVIAGIDDGLMIGRLASADASGITGAFGLEIRCAYVIEKGAITGTVNHALVAGNMYDAPEERERGGERHHGDPFWHIAIGGLRGDRDHRLEVRRVPLSIVNSGPNFITTIRYSTKRSQWKRSRAISPNTT